jgi:hypothetical protein
LRASKKAPATTNSLTIFLDIGASNFVSGLFYRLKVKGLFASEQQTASNNASESSNSMLNTGLPPSDFLWNFINHRRHDPADNNEGWAGAA